MLSEMDADDWREWTEYAQLRPFGAMMEGLYHGTVASLLYNTNRGKGEKGLTPEDFFPHLKTMPKREQSPRAMRLAMALHQWKAKSASPRPTSLGEPPPGSLSPPPGG